MQQVRQLNVVAAISHDVLFLCPSHRLGPGLISVGEVESSFVRCLVAFNGVQLADDEALQQDLTSSSAMRAMRSVDCLYCLLPPLQVSRGGPSCGVLACIGGGLDATGEVHFVVLSHTSDAGEWSVLWHVPVEAHRAEGVKTILLQIYQFNAPQTLTSDQTWTPMKRLASVMEQAPEETPVAEDAA